MLHEHLCISSCLGSDQLSASTHRRTPVILVSRAGSHFPPPLSLRPSLSFKSSFVVLFHSSSSIHLSSLFWLVASISSFTLHLTARPTHPLPSLWLSLTHLLSQHQLLSFQSEELRHVVLQGPEYYKILHSKLKNLQSALPFFRPLISLYGSIWPAPPRALHPCVPVRATLSCRSAGPES